MDVVNDIALAVDSSPKSSTKALVSGAVEPDNGVDTTGDESLWRRWSFSWLDEQPCLFAFLLSLSRLQIFRNLVARECLLQKHRLPKGGWEIDKDPAVPLDSLDALELSLGIL